MKCSDFTMKIVISLNWRNKMPRVTKSLRMEKDLSNAISKIAENDSRSWNSALVLILTNKKYHQELLKELKK